MTNRELEEMADELLRADAKTRPQGIDGENAILFESHLKIRRRREIYAQDGIVDPAYTMDRWGKRTTVGMYSRSHPNGRRVNGRTARRDRGSGFYYK